eukprot:9429842-Pyramimonas_sp.AAC.1
MTRRRDLPQASGSTPGVGSTSRCVRSPYRTHKLGKFPSNKRRAEGSTSDANTGRTRSLMPSISIAIMAVSMPVQSVPNKNLKRPV